MDKREDWPDPNPGPGTDLDDLDKRFNEVLSDLTEARKEIEELKYGQWIMLAALVAILWKLF